MPSFVDEFRWLEKKLVEHSSVKERGNKTERIFIWMCSEDRWIASDKSKECYENKMKIDWCN